MKQSFDLVKIRLLEALAERGYKLESEKAEGKCMSAVFVSEQDAYMLEYDGAGKLFRLYRGTAGDEESFAQQQSYLFDPEEGQEIREASGVANEFIDTLQVSSAKAQTAAARQQKRKKDKDSDESTAEFFVNRIPSVLPECREPLTQHKAHYGQILPRHFCNEVVTVAMHDILRSGNKRKCTAFFELLDNMYKRGDLDTRSIIIQVLLGSITNSADKEFVESIISTDTKKAWAAGRKYVGKDVKPEKVNKMAMIAQYQAETLQNKR